jgi:hypothetical protein
MVAGGWGACSGSLGGAKSDAGRDGTVRDATVAVDRFSGADRRDGSVDRHDGSTDRLDGGARCSPLDLATECPGGDLAECQPTWAEVLAHPQCSGSPANLGPVSREGRVDCGGYHIRGVTHVDWGSSYYYDITSGALVAIYLLGSGPGSGTCFGPSQGIVVDCTNAPSTPPVCTLYGGALSSSDAGLLGDGGGSNCLPVTGDVASFAWNAPCARDGGTDGGTACYASCGVSGGAWKYVGCVSGSPVATMCYASCSECP